MVIVILVVFSTLIACSPKIKEPPPEYNSTVLLMGTMRKAVEQYQTVCGEIPENIQELSKAIESKKCLKKDKEFNFAFGAITTKDKWGNTIFFEKGEGASFHLISCGAEWLEIDSTSQRASLPEIYVQKGGLIKDRK